MGVNTPGRIHREQTEHVTIVGDLLGGTSVMRTCAEKYLPRQKFETADDYKTRLNGATLYPAYKETIGSMRGRVFADRPLRHDIPEWIKNEVFPDVDRNGQTIDIFLPKLFDNALAYGHVGVLVDSPEFDSTPTLAVAKEKKLHPYYVMVNKNQILDARAEDGTLVHLRLAFEDEVRDDADEFLTTTKRTVRVYDKVLANGVPNVQVRLYVEKKTPTDGQVEYDLVSTRLMAVPEIPFMCFYTGFERTFVSKPPLIDLAYLNAKHWSLQSSYDTMCMIAMIPILTLIGADASTNLLIGSKSAVKISNPDGDLKYTEHTGAAMRTGREALDKLKEEMRESGAKLLLPQLTSANKTATQASEEAQRENSPLATMVVDFATSFRELLRLTCMWRKEALPEGARIELRPNLKPDFAPTDTAQVLINAADRNLISFQTVFDELQRRSIIQNTLTWEEEKSRIAKDPSGYLIRSLEVKEKVQDARNEEGQDSNPLPQSQNQ